MPFALKPQEENKNNQQAGGPPSVSGVSTSFSTGLPGQEATKKGGPKSSGQYTNIQSYLEANKPQAEQMGQGLAQKAEQKGQEAQQKIQSFAGQAPKMEAYDPTKALQGAQGLSEAQKQQYKEFKQTGGYKGPGSAQEIQGFEETQKAAQEAGGLASNLGSEAGQTAALRQAYARPTYSAGQSRLDQALLQGAEGSKQAMQQAYQKYGKLADMFGQTYQDVQSGIDTAKQQALANKEALLKQEQETFSGLLNPIQQRAQAAMAARPKEYQDIMSDVADTTLSEKTLGQLGLAEGTKLYDLNLADYIKANEGQLGLEQAATAEERSKYQALRDLVGDQSRMELGAEGAQDLSPVMFAKDQLMKDIAGKQKEYETLVGKSASMNPLVQQLGTMGAIDWSGLGGKIQGAVDTPDEIKAYLDIINTQAPGSQYGGIRNWYQDAQSGGGGAIGAAYKQLQDYINSVQSFGGDRVIRKG